MEGLNIDPEIVKFIKTGRDWLEHEASKSVKFCKGHEDAIIPKKGSEGAAGYDLYACEEATVLKDRVIKVSTGIKVAIPKGYYGRIAPRSGLGCKGLDVHAGVCDSDYRGIVMVALIDHDQTTSYHRIKKGDRIAQLVVEKIWEGRTEVVDSLDETKRGDGGFGSTGN